MFNLACYHFVSTITTGDKRTVNAAMRDAPDITPDCFLPPFGLSVGEWTTFNVLNERPRSTRKPPARTSTLVPHNRTTAELCSRFAETDDDEDGDSNDDGNDGDDGDNDDGKHKAANCAQRRRFHT